MNIKPMKRKLVVYACPSSLWLASFEGVRLEAAERVLLRETSEESLRSRVSTFLQKRKPKETVLFLSRSEVLQKELVLTASESLSLKSNLQKKLEEILPDFHQELAYGVALSTEQRRGVVLAIPEKHLNEKLRFLNSCGIFPDEIFTEDQALLWQLLERKESRSVLLLDDDEERALALFVRDGQIVFSRSFLKQNQEPQSFAREFLGELSIAFLEAGNKAEKMILSGNWPGEIKAQIQENFLMPMEMMPVEETFRGVPSCIRGAEFIGKYPVISLLPKEEKVKRWKQSKQKAGHEVLAISLLFTGVLVLGFVLHLGMMDMTAKKLDREIQTLKPDAEKCESMIASLKLVAKCRATKEKLLGLLKDMAIKVPTSIRLTELRSDDGMDASAGVRELTMKGESPSHAYLSETVQVLENSGYLTGTKLGQTRVRKRLNEDYFEFEVTGQWKA